MGKNFYTGNKGGEITLDEILREAFLLEYYFLSKEIPSDLFLQTFLQANADSLLQIHSAN